MTPLPYRGGDRGGVSGFFPAQYLPHHSISFISLTPPLPPPLQGRGDIACVIFQNTIPFGWANCI